MHFSTKTSTNNRNMNQFIPEKFVGAGAMEQCTFLNPVTLWNSLAVAVATASAHSAQTSTKLPTKE